jgi:hypothetical protein
MWIKSLIIPIFLPFLFSIYLKAHALDVSAGQPDKVGISVFIHICTINHWHDVLEKKLSRIKNSGLYDACDSIFLGVLGTGDVSSFQERYPKVTILFQDPNMGSYERATLLSLHTFCLSSSPKHLVLYLHTKGVTRPVGGGLYIEDWVNYMEYFAIDRWQDCVTTLQNHDACGVNWRSHPHPHFNGNFWWATAKYISTLPGSIDSDYFAPEFWIGLMGPRVHCFRESGVFCHYTTPYPESYYVIQK